MPLPRSPLSFLGLPRRFFRHRGWITFVPCSDVNLIKLDLPGELYLGLGFYNSRSELRCHLMNIVFVQTELLGDLSVGEVQSH